MPTRLQIDLPAELSPAITQGLTDALKDRLALLAHAWADAHTAPAIVNALREATVTGCEFATDEEITAAQTLCREGEIEVDSGAEISRGDPNGSYIQAWLWLPNGQLNSGGQGGRPEEEHAQD